MFDFICKNALLTVAHARARVSAGRSELPAVIIQKPVGHFTDVKSNFSGSRAGSGLSPGARGSGLPRQSLQEESP